ncbi:HAMP domain-containing sensor histidine kinase [Adlercreutzia sp. ZJ304]|uniref:sensor histidine kinase n=1 Tax=Adlercreutzia sp. ZJ304 TaxID=2709791 RepID=UPI0013EA9854|nr:HAMP domain-containing sensor histidine kinase [Adlercreutzia sp. ZJ304]
MLKRLRLRFIFLNMVLAAVVLTAAFGAICYIDYQSRVHDLYEELTFTLNQAQSPTASQIEQLFPLRKSESDANGADAIAAADENLADTANAENAASSEVANANSAEAQPENQTETAYVPDAQQQEPAPESTSASAAASAAGSAQDQQTQQNQPNTTIGENSQSQISMPEIGTRDEMIIPIAVYLVKSDGVYTALGDYASASISHSLLLQANAEALAYPENSGLLEDVGLYFERRETSNGTLIAYADESNVDTWKSLAWTLVGVGVAVLLAFLVINIFFSWWALRPAQKAWDQQTQFVADASHELKTPLTVILANMAIVKSQPDATAAEQSQWIESTQTEAKRMQQLVNDMLDLARPENATRAEMPHVPTDLTDLVETEVLQFESVAFERGVVLESELAPNTHVLGNPARLQRMVSTLIDNACKYANENGSVNVTLSTARGKDAKLTVRNTGAPIPSEDLPHVFDRFYRADKARTSGKGGYGLGLAIAQEIAHEHGGDITVESSEGSSGTAFIVKLPLVD